MSGGSRASSMVGKGGNRERSCVEAHLDLGRLEGGDGAGEGGSDASHFDERSLVFREVW